MTTPRLLFDARMVTPQMHGISRYAYRLLLALSEPDAPYELVVMRTGQLLEGPMTERGIESIDPGIRSYSIPELWRIPKLQKRMRADLYYAPTFFAPPCCGCPHVMTIHDLTHLLPGMTSLKHRIYYSRVVGPAARRAVRVMTETRFVADQLVARFGLAPEKVVVMPSGAGLEAASPQVERADEVLCIVNDKPHKNAGAAVEVLDLLRVKHPDIRLVLVGKLPAEVAATVRNHAGIDSHPFLEEAELAGAFARARAFLFPSFSEGFGYPPLEAMLHGTPVVSSDTSCMPEVLGDACLYASPDDASAMADQLARLLDDPALAKEMVARGRDHAARYSWESMGTQAREVVAEAIAHPSS